MEKRGILILCLVIVFSLQIISAANTEMTIKTLANHNLNVNVYNPEATGQAKTIKTFFEKTETSGEITLSFSSPAGEYDLSIFVLAPPDPQGGVQTAEQVFSEQFYGNTAGEDVIITLLPGEKSIEPKIEEPEEEIVLEDNSTINNTELEDLEEDIVIQEDDEETTSGSTGFAVFGEEGIIPLSTKTLYYVLGFVALLVIVLFGFKFVGGREHKSQEIKVKKLSELKAERKEKIEDYKDIIESAEKKIKEAQVEINSLKNNDKIKQAEKKLEEDKKDLERLRAGQIDEAEKEKRDREEKEKREKREKEEREKREREEKERKEREEREKRERED